jgi:hypothetical protein
MEQLNQPLLVTVSHWTIVALPTVNSSRPEEDHPRDQIPRRQVKVEVRISVRAIFGK